MKKQLFFALIIIAIAALLSVFLVAVKPEPERAAIQRNDLLVDVLRVHTKDVPLIIKTQGLVEPKNQTSLLAEVSGSIERVSDQFVVGGLLKKGDFILQISDSDYQLQIERAKVSIIAAQSTLAQEKTLARIAQQEFEWRERKNLSAESKDAALRKPQIRAARANVEAARVEIKNAQKQMAKTTIRAPYDGIVRSKQAEQGQFVSPGAPLGSLFSVESVNINLSVPQEKLRYIELPSLNEKSVNASVKVYASESPNAATWDASLVRSEGVVDSRTHFLNLIAEVKDPYNLTSSDKELLRVGTFVFAEIEGKVLSDVIELSNSYIQSGEYVWVVNEKDELEKRDITIVYSQNESTFIQGGLNDGDRVCKTLMTGYLPGTKVVVYSVEEQKKNSLISQDTAVTADSQ